MRCFFIILLSISVFFKLQDFQLFSYFIEKNFSYQYGALIAKSIIGIEVGVVINLIVNPNKLVYKILLMFFFVLTMFLVYLFMSGYEDNCFCFGTLVDTNVFLSILKNVVLLSLIFYGLYFRKFDNGVRLDFILTLSSFLILMVFVQLVLDTNRNYFVNIEVKEIKMVELKKAKNYLLIDVRQREQFSAGHINSAFNLPYTTVKESVINIISEKLLSSHVDTVIVYCDTRICNLSRNFILKYSPYFPNKSFLKLAGDFDQWLKN